jgi:hypothetical protein
MTRILTLNKVGLSGQIAQIPADAILFTPLSEADR